VKKQYFVGFFPPGSAQTDWVRQVIEHLFNGRQVVSEVFVLKNIKI